MQAHVDHALEMTDARLAALPFEARAMLSSVRNQLVFMRDVVASGRCPTTAEKNALSLGVIAVRELEDTDPAFCDALTGALFEFRKL